MTLYNEVIYIDNVAVTEEALITHLACRRAQHIPLTSSTMSLIVTLLVMTLVTGCWSSPQRRNWTPQAILYLKGAQGHRSVLQRTSREEGDTFHIMTRNQRSSDGPGSSLSSILLELLQQAVEEGRGHPDDYPDERDLILNYL